MDPSDPMEEGEEASPSPERAQFGEIDANHVKDVGAAVAAGVAAGNVELAGADAETMEMPVDEEERKRQEKVLQEFEMRRKLQALVVPTNDQEVRQRLRALKEPMTLFGEMQMERRDRLRKLLLKALEDGGDLGDAMQGDDDEATVVPQNELFYTEGTEELLSARQRIAEFSMRQAKQRVESQRRKMDDPEEDDSAVAEEVASTCKRLANQCSELGDDRPIQSCAFSPDGSLLAAAGEAPF